MAKEKLEPGEAKHEAKESKSKESAEQKKEAKGLPEEKGEPKEAKSPLAKLFGKAAKGKKGGKKDGKGGDLAVPRSGISNRMPMGNLYKAL